MRFEPRTWKYRIERSTAEPKSRGGAGGYSVPPLENKGLSYKWKPKKRGHEKTPLRGKRPQNIEILELPSFLGISPPSRGSPSPPPRKQATRPREGTFPRSSLADLDGGAGYFAGDTEGYYVGEAYHHCRATAGDPVAVGRLNRTRT